MIPMNKQQAAAVTPDAVQHAKETIWSLWTRGNDQPARLIDELASLYADDISWHGPHPINSLDTCTAVIDAFWHPLLKSFPDLHRRAYVFLGGVYDGETEKGEHWVCGHGEMIATFAQDFLGIPASGQTVRIRFGEFNRFKDGKIVEVYTLFDFVSLMSQVGIEVLPKPYGRQIWTPGPVLGNGLMLQPQLASESEISINLLEDMLFRGMKYQSEKATGRTMNGYWTDDMRWYGPHGLGAAFGLEEFYANAQGPIVAGYPDRIGAFHKARFGEGRAICMGGLATLQGTHTGRIFGMEPTGKRVHWKIMDFYIRREDKLHENWVIVDIPYACMQSGVDLFERMRSLASS